LNVIVGSGSYRPTPEPSPRTPTPVSITIWTDKTSYQKGDDIKVEGEIEGAKDRISLMLTVYGPNNRIITDFEISATSSGYFTTIVKTDDPEWRYDGTYSIRGTYDGTSLRNSAEFYFDGKYSESQPEPTYTQSGSVIVPQGTSVPGCEATNQCYIPFEVRIDVGGVVTWSNDDSAAHTVTSGSAADGPSGAFDSSLFMAGTTFEHRFDSPGEYPYFCMVHPWMEGIVTVGQGGTPPPQYSINVKTDQNSYFIGETLEITGVLKPADGSSVVLQIFNPQGNRVYNESVRSFSSGLFSAEIRLSGSDFAQTGTYSVKALANSASDTVEFFLQEKITSPPPSGDSAFVSVPQGTSVPGCETSNECYLPYVVAVDAGGVVTWSNDDSAAHTVTGGSAADGPSGVFDSSLFMAGTTFEHKFELRCF
jgi:plastocyanin